MDPLALIAKYYPKGSRLFAILTDHSRQVADKSLEIARNLPGLHLDFGFLETAAMLHDIGIFKTRAPAIGCTGEMPYICHGYLGREILDSEGLAPAFGLVAERHTGAGITLENIRKNHLPLPEREMVPQSDEEIIICCADKFFSKSPEKKDRVLTVPDIIEELAALDPGHAERFTVWADRFRLT